MAISVKHVSEYEPNHVPVMATLIIAGFGADPQPSKIYGNSNLELWSKFPVYFI